MDQFERTRYRSENETAETAELARALLLAGGSLAALVVGVLAIAGVAAATPASVAVSNGLPAGTAAAVDAGVVAGCVLASGLFAREEL